MTAGVLLALVATVVSADGRFIAIDKGLLDGLRPGDRGEVFYPLIVRGESKRIGLGPVEIVSVDASSASAELPEGMRVRPGFKVELQIDKERLSPGDTVATAREHLGEERAAQLADRYLAELGPALAPSDPPPSDPPPIDAVVLRIAAGNYPIGLHPGKARFFNETPRFERPVAEFWIDAKPVEPTGYDFFQAQAHCAAHGTRLPTEFEWEVASRDPEFETVGRFEWTASWYLPYPGNRHPEEEYGERFRVLRGSADTGSFRAQARRYLGPLESNSRVGFRCASSASDFD